jgi:uncharacterized protein GlcG (DUF336 family)
VLVRLRPRGRDARVATWRGNRLGGVPVDAGNERIGAAGVGGAPGGHLEAPCAIAAVDRLRDQPD